MNKSLHPPVSKRCAKVSWQVGFTLVETVIAIVITGIVAAIVALFIRLPAYGYLDSVARADLADTADTALQRIARDLRLALPNSIRCVQDGSGNYYLELLLTRTGGRYLSVDDNPASGNVLDFSPTASLKFDIVGPTPSGAQTIQPNSDSVVVYNLGAGITGADAYAGSNRALITAVSNSTSNATITMASNPFAAQNPSMPSPYYHFQVISGPVTYLCNPSLRTITRYWGYTIVANQPVTVAALTSGSGAASALLASGIQSCNFAYGTTDQISNAIVDLQISLQATSSDNGTSGTVGLFQQVHVDNTP
jgi:MSHA biogenesis protein MshO